MKIKIGVYSHSGAPRIRDFNGPSLVEMALSQSTMFSNGELENMRAQIDKLSAIVGRLLEKLPESEWLEVVQIYGVEAAE